jgi:hypothetical protein
MSGNLKIRGKAATVTSLAATLAPSFGPYLLLPDKLGYSKMNFTPLKSWPARAHPQQERIDAFLSLGRK